MGPVFFASEGWEWLSNLLRESEKTIILCDSNTQQCLEYLKDKCIETTTFSTITIPSGEKNKNLNTCAQVWNELTELGADRHTLLLNLGGGMVTDLGGFVAATFMRGIRFVHIPTSLMAMADAAIGGKTGVDLGVLKNQIGLFAQPQAVIIDNGFLSTLPQREKKNGMAEVLKHAFISDSKILGYLNDVDKIIKRSVRVKTKIVRADELEKGGRKKLNFGHTIGHAIESHFLSTDIPLSHGESIAAGMKIEAFISSVISGLSRGELAKIYEQIDLFFLKIELCDSDILAIKKLMLRDKKNKNGKVKFVLLSKIGNAVIDKEMSEEVLDAAFAFYANVE